MNEILVFSLKTELFEKIVLLPILKVKISLTTFSAQ